MKKPILELFAEPQQTLKTDIFKVQPKKVVANKNTFFESIKQHGIDVCSLAFGLLGKRFVEFTNKVDLDHPEIISGEFFADLMGKSDLKQLNQYLQLSKLAIENQINELNIVFEKGAKALFDIKNTSTLLKKNQYLRLYKDPIERNKYRSLKEACIIDLETSSKKLGAIWDSVPSLMNYGRFGNFQAEQVKKATERLEIYQQYRLSSMCTEISKSLDELVEIENYYGFQRITMVTTAVLLAKMHGFTNIGNCIAVPASSFMFDFELGQLYEFSFKEEPIKRKILDYRYQPVIYPYHLYEPKTKDLEEIFNYLEAFPEADGKPIFDRLVVIVPGVEFPRNNNNYAVFDGDCKRHDFEHKEDCKKYLDKLLIEQGQIVPALLGEKGGNSYFICFLN